jgi:hypothetical protein
MNFDSAQKKKFMTKLFYGLPPFDQFVAKGDLETTEEIFFSRKEVMKRISNQINNTQHSLLIPVVGETGNGKTHFMWGIKNTFNIDAFTTFIALPRSKDKFYYYVYSDFLEEFAATHLREFTQNFGDRFGANEHLFGFFRTHNTVKVFMNAYESLKENFRHRTALEQCVSVTISHLMNPEKFQVAERWLLGEMMDFDDLFVLNVNEDLSGKFMAETMLKLLINNYNPGILLLFDDFEKASHEYSSLGTSYFDDDFDEDSENNEEEETLIEKIAKLLINTDNFKIVISMGFPDAEKILSEFKEKLGDKRLMADPISLTKISLNDVYQLYLERMKKFCYANKANHPVIEFSLNDASRDKSEIPDILFFPLTKAIIKHIYEISGGNARRILKNFKRIFDALIFEELKVENLNLDYKNFISTF